MRITQEQEDILNSFVCERISGTSSALNCAQKFESARGTLLVRYLKGKGIEEDKENKAAFYIVRTADHIPLIFFSLKCGSLFSPFNIEELENDAKNSKYILSLLSEGLDSSNPDSVRLFETVEELAIKINCNLDEMTRRIMIKYDNRKQQILPHTKDYRMDEAKEQDRPIYRVFTTFSGIEIGHFCADDQGKKYWKTLPFAAPMGKVLFWRFILPKIEEARKIVGCQYAYLFAADDSLDNSLVNYYNVDLKFIKIPDIGTSKPRYDYCCEFLAQEISKLQMYRDQFFDNFNIDDENLI